MACWGRCHAPIKSRRAIPDQRRATQRKPVRPHGRQRESESARRQPEPLLEAGRHRPNPNSKREGRRLLDGWIGRCATTPLWRANRDDATPALRDALRSCPSSTNTDRATGAATCRTFGSGGCTETSGSAQRTSTCASRRKRQQPERDDALLVRDRGARGTGEWHDVYLFEPGLLAPAGKVAAREVKRVAELDQHVERHQQPERVFAAGVINDVLDCDESATLRSPGKAQANDRWAGRPRLVRSESCQGLLGMPAFVRPRVRWLSR